MPAPLHPPDLSEFGATTIPRELMRWLDDNPVTKLTRTQGYVSLPVFNVAVNWLGYSDIVATFNFEGPNNFSLKSMLAMPVSPNYMLCIMWRDAAGDVFRYAIWRNVGEVIYFNLPLYTGQKVAKNFRFEIWSTNVAAVTNNNVALYYTSVLGNVDWRYGTDFVLVNNDPIVTNFSAPLHSQQSGVLVTTAGTTDFNGTYVTSGEVLGSPVYTLQGNPSWNGTVGYPYSAIYLYTPIQWIFANGGTQYYIAGSFGATPDLVPSWSANFPGVTPEPVVTTIIGGPLPFIWPAGSYPASN